MNKHIKIFADGTQEAAKAAACLILQGVAGAVGVGIMAGMLWIIIIGLLWLASMAGYSLSPPVSNILNRFGPWGVGLVGMLAVVEIYAMGLRRQDSKI